MVGMILVIGLFFAMCTWSLWHLWRWNILPNPSSRCVLEQANALLLFAGLKPDNHRLIDCGCGLGFSMAYWRSKWNSVLGFEGSRTVWLIAQCIRPWTRLPFHALHCSDWYEGWAPQSKKGDILFFYICPKAMQQAGEKLCKHPGPLDVWLISHTFALPGHFPTKTQVVQGLYHTPIYLYHLVKET